MTTDTILHNELLPPLEQGRLLLELDRYEDLLKLLMPQLDSQEDSAIGYRLCFIALQRLNRHEDSLLLAEHGLAQHPDDTYLHLFHASALSFMGRYDRALEQLERILSVDPELAEAHYRKAGALFRLKRRKEAKEAIETALSLDPGNPNYLALLALIEYWLDNRQRSAEILETALRDNPQHAEALAVKAETAQGFLNRLRLMRTAIAQDPTNTNKQAIYTLYTRQIPRDLALWLLLALVVGGSGIMRPHPAAHWLLEAAIPLTLVSGLFMLRRSYYHLAGFTVTFASVFCSVRYWDNNFSIGNIPLGLLLGAIASVVIAVFRIKLFDGVEELKTKRQQLQFARKNGRASELLQEWLPSKVIVAVLALAGLPTLFLYGMLYNPPPHLLLVMFTAPLLYRWAGVMSFGKAFVACFKLAAWTALPLMFFSIIGHQEPEKGPLLLIILYLFTLYRAWRQYRLANQDD
ncbi:tetratricopeptide repeat protein [Trichlorobacter lovleyi]|uniref:tetratricopeptide repeat protein n=1 Tax=Trichlorobacter lovleyi TaxID=313985 RepID=UPI00223F17DB|nr:tetratricopeptide repeat protein [Trichlorobacter lovleyi]QOX79857.1 tetratricopeptide repeat protein [Trichlorobacter lovleyi]